MADNQEGSEAPENKEEIQATPEAIAKLKDAQETARTIRHQETVERIDLSTGPPETDAEVTILTDKGQEGYFEKAKEPEEEEDSEEGGNEYTMNLLDNDWHFHYNDNHNIRVVEAPCHPMCIMGTGGMMTAHAIGFAHKEGSGQETMVPAVSCLGCGITKFLGPVREPPTAPEQPTE